MTNPEDIDTIRDILSDFGIDDMLSSTEFQSLVSQLENRENIMITEIGPLMTYRNGLDRIIREV